MSLVNVTVKPLTREEAIQRLVDADYFNVADCTGARIPAVGYFKTSPGCGWVSLEGDFNADQLEAFLFFLREAEKVKTLDLAPRETGYNGN